MKREVYTHEEYYALMFKYVCYLRNRKCPQWARSLLRKKNKCPRRFFNILRKINSYV